MHLSARARQPHGNDPGFSRKLRRPRRDGQAFCHAGPRVAAPLTPVSAPAHRNAFQGSDPGRLPRMKYTTPLPGALALVMLAAAIPCPAQSSYDLLFSRRPRRRRHRRAMVHGRRRGAGRPDRRDRPARGRTAKPPSTRGPRHRARIHRPAGAVRVQRARRRPRGFEDHAGDHDRGHRRGGVDRADQRADVRRRPGHLRAVRLHARLPTLEGYFKAFERRGAAINLATFVGSGGVRDFVIGKENRRATPDGASQMCALVDKAMREGALGVSSSLQYMPDI